MHVNDYLPLSRRDPTRFEGGAQAWSQLPRANIGGIFNMDGAAVANYASILEPLT